ncbi:Thioredoxin [Nocardioides terrae]|uniref:Thioredoxin n=1 Tax=Nocardioides terrae TaxID=574651 RepID=A0A1I1EMQ6_9ACTN|nr:thioredoxin family protein [Nocardioides terrae]SFB87946.1 Thioredoxin [Nocardioides terrae]
MTGLWVALAAIAIALVFGTFRALTDGRFRGTHKPAGHPSLVEEGRHPSLVEEGRRARLETTAWTQLGAAATSTELGERATLVQFSSAFCAPCRVTRRVLSDVAETTPGVVHLEVDAEHHLDATRRLGILRTPTTLILDPTGREIARAAGAPRKDQVLATIPARDLT